MTIEDFPVGGKKEGQGVGELFSALRTAIINRVKGLNDSSVVTAIESDFSKLNKAMEASETAYFEAMDELKKDNPEAAKRIEDNYIETLTSFDSQF